MKKIIIGIGIATSLIGTAILTAVAFHESKKHNSIIGERYKTLMKAATNNVDKEIIEEIYKTEKEMCALADIVAYHHKHKIECADFCDREAQIVGKFNDLEEQLSEELRIISRGF